MNRYTRGSKITAAKRASTTRKDPPHRRRGLTSRIQMEGEREIFPDYTIYSSLFQSTLMLVSPAFIPNRKCTIFPFPFKCKLVNDVIEQQESSYRVIDNAN